MFTCSTGKTQKRPTASGENDAVRTRLATPPGTLSWISGGRGAYNPYLNKDESAVENRWNFSMSIAIRDPGPTLREEADIGSEDRRLKILTAS